MGTCAQLHSRWRQALRDRLAGAGLKPPYAALVKSQGGERYGKGLTRLGQVWNRETNASEPLMTCRKRAIYIETGFADLTQDQPKGSLLTAWVMYGMKVA